MYILFYYVQISWNSWSVFFYITIKLIISQNHIFTGYPEKFTLLGNRGWAVYVFVIQARDPSAGSADRIV